MIDPKIFIEGRVYTLDYWFGGDLCVDTGTVEFFSSELPEEPHTRYDGLILTQRDDTSQFPTQVWIPYDNILRVAIEATT